MARSNKKDQPVVETPVAETPDETKAPRERKPGLTLSQRRALLRLLDAGDAGVTPPTAFKALPYEHAVTVGYATATELDGEDTDESRYVLTQAGRERAESINPGYRDWSAGETVAGDESRPTHGTHRTEREKQIAKEREAKAKAEAAEKAKAEKEAAKA